MGTGEEITSKPVTSEMPATPSYHDWASTMQVSAYNHAYYGPGGTPPPFFPPAVASPTPHPYLWGSKAPSTAHANPDLEGKVPGAKDQGPAKKAKETPGTTGWKPADTGNAGSALGNDVISQSSGNVSEGSSDASGEDTSNQQERTGNRKERCDQMFADGANSENDTPGANNQYSTPGKPVATVRATNLNIGMELWDASSTSTGVKVRQNTSGAKMGLNNQWIQGDRCWQDERELKQQKRKQSNRESARRSRLRRQAECEELQKRVETLGDENRTLREELQRLSEECEKLESQNSSVKEELEHLCGSNAVANLE